MTEEIKFKPVNIKPEAHEQLKQFCDEHGMTMAAITEKAIKKYMHELKKLFDITDTPRW